MQKDLLQLNPDAFSRFQGVCNEIKGAYKNQKVKILDIGGASTYLHNFLKSNGINFELTILDIVDFDNKPPSATVVLKSAEDTGFEKDSFDVVTGIDMLEHIPNETMKKNIINEAIRVSKNLVIFAGPCEEDAVTEFEHKLNNQNKLLFSKDQKWLAEHFKYGKPSKKLLSTCYEKAQLSYSVYSLLALDNWYVSSVANLMPAVNPAVPQKKLHEINQDFNERFLKPSQKINEETRGYKGYRTFFVGSKLSKLEPEPTATKATESGSEEYIDVLLGALNATKDSQTKANDLKWYITETNRLKKEVADLAEQNSQLSKSLLRMTGGKIVRQARGIERRFHKRRMND